MNKRNGTVHNTFFFFIVSYSNVTMETDTDWQQAMVNNCEDESRSQKGCAWGAGP